MVGASISMRAHNDSRLNVVFLGERWFFSALPWTLTEKIQLTSRRTGEETNEPLEASSMRASTHRRKRRVGTTGPFDARRLACRTAGRPWHGCRTIRGHHTKMRNAYNTKRLNQHGHACAHARLHICTARDSTVSQCVGGASRPESTRLHGAIFQ